MMFFTQMQKKKKKNPTLDKEVNNSPPLKKSHLFSL